MTYFLLALYGVSRSQSKLPQMMIKMFIHQDRPLLRRQRSKERMRILRTAPAPPSASPVAPTDVRIAVTTPAPVLPQPTAYRRSNAPASAPPSSCPSVFQFAAPGCSAGV